MAGSEIFCPLISVMIWQNRSQSSGRFEQEVTWINTLNKNKVRKVLNAVKNIRFIFKRITQALQHLALRKTRPLKTSTFALSKKLLAQTIHLYGIVIFMWLNVTIPTETSSTNFSSSFSSHFSSKFSSKNDLEAYLDELVEISPEIFLGPGQSIYLNLKSVHHHWKLSEFLRNKEENKILHPFYKCLEKFHLRHGCEFIICESPSEAAWVQKHRRELMKDFIFILPKGEAFYELLSASPVREISSWLQDLLAQDKINNDEKMATDLHLLCDALEYLGIKNLLELHVSMTQKNFLQSLFLKYGSLIKIIHSRLNGSDDFHMHPYTPPMHLRAEFFPKMENPMSVDIFGEVGGEIPIWLLDILCQWESRLESRKSLLSGLEVIFECDLESTSQFHPPHALPQRNPAQKKVLRALFPRPLRDPLFIHDIFLEKWAAAANDKTFFKDRISKVTIKSVGLQNASEHQLHLFDHTHEDVYQEWGLLLDKHYERGMEDSQDLMRALAREDFMSLFAKEEKRRSLDYNAKEWPIQFPIQRAM